jgi:hypothetical protein
MLNSILSVVLFITSVTAITAVVLGAKRLLSMQQIIREQQELTSKLKSDIAALFTGAVGEDSKIQKLESRTRRIIERQEQLENTKHSERPYEQAIRMVQQGSSCEDVMNICNLSRGEADLIIMIHGDIKPQSEGADQFH